MKKNLNEKFISITIMTIIVMLSILGCNEKTQTTVAKNIDKRDFKEKAIVAYLKADYLESGKCYFKNTKEKAKEEEFMYSDEIKLRLVEALVKNQHFVSMEDMNNKGYYIKDLDKDNISEIICANSLNINVYKFKDDDFKLINLKLPSDIKSICVGKIAKDKMAIIASNYGDKQEETSIYTVEDEKIIKKLTFTADEFTNNIVKDIDGDGIYEIAEIKGDELSKTVNWNKISEDYKKELFKSESMSNLSYIKLRNINTLSNTIALTSNPTDEEIASFLTKALKYERAIYYLTDAECLEIEEKPYYKVCEPVDKKDTLIEYYNKYFSKAFVKNALNKFYKFENNKIYVNSGDNISESIITKVISKEKQGDNLKVKLETFDGTDKGSIECILTLENGRYKIESGSIFI